MSEPEPLSSELKGFEASLAALVPSASAINRDRLMYEAGRASCGSRALPWITGAASSAGLCALVVAVLAIASGDIHRHRSDHSVALDVTEDVIAAAPPPIDPASYAHLRRLLTKTDLAALDTLPLPTPAANTNDRTTLLHELLN